MALIELAGKAQVWLYPGGGGWHFVTLPKTLVAKVKKVAASVPRGWGSVRVSATVGGTTWQTSVFPDKDSGSYVLPIKKEVRNTENIAAGDWIRFTLAIKA